MRLKLLHRLYGNPLPHYTHRFSTPIKGFTRHYVTNIVRSALSQRGYKGKYPGDSFRRGAATLASESGLSKDEDVGAINGYLILTNYIFRTIQTISSIHPEGFSRDDKRLTFIETPPLAPHSPQHSTAHQPKPYVNPVATRTGFVASRTLLGPPCVMCGLEVAWR